jgi:hypothetical protein
MILRLTLDVSRDCSRFETLRWPAGMVAIACQIAQFRHATTDFASLLSFLSENLRMLLKWSSLILQSPAKQLFRSA